MEVRSPARRRMLAGILALALALPAGAQPAAHALDWTNDGSPAGVPVQSVGGTEDVLIASTWRDGVWRSTDNGHTWEKIPDLDITTGDVVFDPTRPGTGYIAGFGGVAQTRDAGQTWQTITEDSPALGLDVTRTGIAAYAAEDTETGAIQLHISHDGGDTWTTRSTPLADHAPFEAVAIDPQGENVVITRITETWASDDAGQTWTDIHDGANDVVTTRDGSFYMSSFTDGLVRSTDGGQTWTSLTTPTSANPGPLAALPGGGLLGATSEGVIASEEPTQRWTVYPVDDVAISIVDVEPDPRSQEAYFLTHEDIGVLHLEDLGEDRYDLEGRNAGFPPVPLLGVDAAHEGQTIFAAAARGLYASDDGGASFQHTGAGIGMAATLAADATRGGEVVYAAGQNRALLPFVEVSRDGGASWETHTLSPERGITRDVAAHPTDDSIAAAAVDIPGTESLVRTTTDAGRTWTTNLTLPMFSVEDVAYHTPTGQLMVATGVGVFVEASTGIWAPLTASYESTDAIASGGGHVVAEGLNDTLLRSLPEAPALVPHADPGHDPVDLAVTPDDASTVYSVGSEGGLVACSDDAHPLSPCEDVAPPAPVVRGAAVGPDGTVYAASAQNGLWQATGG